MRLYYLLPAALLLAGLNGCSLLKNSERGPLRDRNHDYVKAKSLPAMQLAPGQSSKRLDPLYPIAGAEPDGQARLQLPPRPQPAPLLATEVFVVQETSTHSWILAQREPAQVWPLAQAFFLSRGFSIAQEHPQQGEFVVRHTSASSIEQEQANRLDYLVRIQPGLEPKTSELLLEYSANGSPFTAGDVALVGQVLTPLQQYMLSASERGDSYSLLASYNQRSPQERVENLGGTLILRVQADMEQAWPAVGRALQDSDIYVRGQSRQQAIYVLDLQKEVKGKKRGVFSGLNNLLKDVYQRIEEEKREERGQQAKQPQQQETIQVDENYHQLRMREEDGAVVLSLEDHLQQAADNNLASSVLNRLREQLNREDFAQVETASQSRMFAERQVQLQEVSGSWQLRLKDKGKAAAWQDLNRVLQNEDFAIHAVLGDESVYVVSVREQQWRREADSSLSFGSLYRRIEEEKRQEREKQARKKEEVKEVIKYRLQLQADDSDSLLLIQNEDASLANSSEARQIMERIQQLLD